MAPGLIAHAEHAAPALGWEPAPVVLVAAALGVAAFARGFVRLRRRGRADLAGSGRAALLGLAVVLALAVLVSPVHAAGERYLLSAHMLQHVVVGDLVPVLVLLAVRGPLLFHVVPAALLRRLRRLAAPLAFLLHPLTALSIWAASLALWHVPAAYEYAATHTLVHDLEHASFVTAGFLVWTQLLDPARRGRLSPRLQLAYAAALFAGAQLLVNTLIISDRPLYELYAGQAHRLLGLSPLRDQQLAALVMMLEMLLTVGTYTAFRLRELFRAPLVLAREREHPFTV